MMRDALGAPTLTFDHVDGIAQAQAQGGLRQADVEGQFAGRELGPIMELQQLRASGVAPAWFVETRLQLQPSMRHLAARLDRQQNFTPRHGSADCGVFHPAQPHDENALTAFRLAGQKAAEAAGFSAATALKLSSVLIELADNVIDHSEAAQTGVIAFSWRPNVFEFAATDRGIGVLASLQKASRFRELASHARALQIATGDGGTRYPEGSGHGSGFRHIFLGLANHRGQLRFRSGDHSLELDGRSPELSSAGVIQKTSIDGFCISVSCSVT